MEEETKKRNTDCLYFLASPLTCKKGSECEYRHSDSARLNPRDCWYWLNGSCRNPNCAFRHPPLDGLDGVKADSFYSPSFSTVPTSKSNVPCYFYFNSICAKGEQCPFLHETLVAQKLVSKSVHESTGVNPLENKISTGDTGPGSVELPVNPPTESLVGPIKMSNHHPKEASCSPSAESIIPEFEEPPTDNPLPSVEFMDQRDQLSPYSSSEELVKECVDQELDERWESSPGFDVLVDDGSEQLAYEDDAEYQLVQTREYDFEGSAGYEHHSAYPDAGYLYDGVYENFDHSDNIYDAASYFQKISDLPREERVFEPMHGNQRRLRRVHQVHDRDDVMDLQDQHRRLDARRMPLNSRKRRRSNPRRSSQERPIRRGMYNGSIHSRLTSQEYESTPNYHDRQGWQGHLGTGRFGRSRLRERERRRNRFSSISSEVQQSSARDDEVSARISSCEFNGPKTLAQIKEEKNRPKLEHNENSPDHAPRLGRRQKLAGDFEGPKPLQELLKQKRSTGQTSTNTKLEHSDINASSCQANNADEEDDDDDDDMFRKRLLHMLS